MLGEALGSEYIEVDCPGMPRGEREAMAQPKPLDLPAIEASLRGRRITTARLTPMAGGAISVELTLGGQIRLLAQIPEGSVFLDDQPPSRRRRG